MEKQVRSFLSALLLVVILACGRSPPPAARVLFIGNSYTSVNDLPHMLTTLAAAGKHPLTVDMMAVGGATLAQHLQTPAIGDRLAAQQWNFVVLQEQSVVPAVATARSVGMYPAVRELVSTIRARGAKPILLLTWGRRDGLPEEGYHDYRTMQSEITAGYLAIADELQVIVAPVGVAWMTAVREDPGLALWLADGSHPSVAGSFLAACTLYATIYHQSPVGLPAPAGLTDELARRLEGFAAGTVLGNPGMWHN